MNAAGVLAAPQHYLPYNMYNTYTPYTYNGFNSFPTSRLAQYTSLQPYPKPITVPYSTPSATSAQFSAPVSAPVQEAATPIIPLPQVPVVPRPQASIVPQASAVPQPQAQVSFSLSQPLNFIETNPIIKNKDDPNAPETISNFKAPEPVYSGSGHQSRLDVNIKRVQPPEIASLEPATDHKRFEINSQAYAQKAFQIPIAVTSAINAPRDTRSPNAAAALEYMKFLKSDDICARSTQLYLEVILKGGSVDEANSAATKIYIDDYNRGLKVEPGSACEASDIAWRKAEAEGKDPVVYSAIAFMDNWPGMKEGNPCAVSGRDYVNAVIDGASHTQANLFAAKSFAVAIKKLSAAGKELRDPACAAATKAYYNALVDKPSPPNAAAMLAFVEKAFDGFSFDFDPVCWRATEAFFDSYAAGNDELTSNRVAAEVFLDEFAKGGAGIPADSPCAAATVAYYKNIPDPPSPANKAAMEAFMSKMIRQGRREPDPVCAASTKAYW